MGGNISIFSKETFTFVLNNIHFLQANIWENTEKEILSDFLLSIRDCLKNKNNNPELPWQKNTDWSNDPIVIKYLNRVKIAVCKSRKTSKIFGYSDDPVPGIKSGILEFRTNFSNANIETQRGLSSIYCLFVILCSLSKYGNSTDSLESSDVTYYIFQETNKDLLVINYDKINTFTSAVSKIYNYVPRMKDIPPNSLFISTGEIEFTTKVVNLGNNIYQVNEPTLIRPIKVNKIKIINPHKGFKNNVYD